MNDVQNTRKLIGRKLVAVRSLTTKELKLFGWYESAYHPAIALIFDDGSILVPSADPEGNDAGALFGFPANQKESDFIVVGLEPEKPVVPVSILVSALLDNLTNALQFDLALEGLAPKPVKGIRRDKMIERRDMFILRAIRNANNFQKS